MKSTERFGLALDIACSAIAVLFSDRLASELGAAREGNVVPLDDEFPQVFAARKVMDRLAGAALGGEIRPADCDVRYFYDVRLRQLRAASVMPSVAVAALADAIGCDPDKFPRPSLLLYRQLVPAVARELGVERKFLSMCWKAEGIDLDAQWRSVRAELLAISAEMEAAQ